MENKQYLDYIMNLETYYSLEDFGNYNMIENSLKTNCYVSQRPKFEVRVDFPIGNEVKEKIMEKNDLKKIYAFLRIYSTENNYINILVYRNEHNYYNSKDILDRINQMQIFKGPIRMHLEIDEYPLKNKY